MKTKLKDNVVISTRDFIRNFASIKNRPTSKRYTVVNHGKPTLLVIPLPRVGNDDWWTTVNPENYPEAQLQPDKPKQHLTLSELREKYSFRSGEKHLSQRIDEIVYGVKR